MISKSDVFSFACLSFIVGIFLSSVIGWPSSALASIIPLILILPVFYKKSRYFLYVSIWMLCLVLGTVRWNMADGSIESAAVLRFSGEEVRAVGVVSGEVMRDTEKAKVPVDVLLRDGSAAAGRIMVYTDKFADLSYRDLVVLEGEMKKPEAIEDFDYRGYLAKSGVSAVMTYPEIRIEERSYFSNIFQRMAAIVYSFKEKLRGEIKDDLPYKEGAVIQGMILGDSGKMNQGFREALSVSGLSHVIAISGSHIVLFAALLFELLIFFGAWRKQAQLSVIILTFIYVFMTGMLASAVRSWIMISLLFLAQMIGRESSGLRSMIFAAAIMLCVNPFLLKHDLGFSLSFLAVCGLIFAGPIFNHFFKRLFRGRLNFLSEVLAMTLSAELFTLPLLVWTFGYFSSLSVIANIIAAPFVPLIMITGVIFPLLGLFFHPLGFIASLVCSLCTKILVLIVEACPHIPFAAVTANLSWWIVFIVYIPFLAWFFRERRRAELEFLGQ